MLYPLSYEGGVLRVSVGDQPGVAADTGVRVAG